MEMKYGDKQEWKEHFCYLLPFFKDKRYIKISNTPILVIYQPQSIPNFIKMKEYIQELAIDAGFNGITFIAQSLFDQNENVLKELDYTIQYEPNCARVTARNHLCQTYGISKKFAIDILMHGSKNFIKKITKGRLFHVSTFDYDAIWDYILKRPINNKKVIAGAFVNCDMTPRRQDRAVIYRGASPEKLEHYLTKLMDKVKKEYSTNIIFISAWNEWGEGMYLEPDELHGYGYLEAVKNALTNAQYEKN